MNNGLSIMKENRRVLGASLIGTAIEFYDFYIYATAAALVFGPLFFPADDKAVQQLAALSSLALAFVARPLGAAVFGHYGDRIGRKATLVGSLLLMGGSTLLIAFLPTYHQIGWVAPGLLCLLRFGQGFGLGGEWGGAALLAVENAPPGWRSRFGMMPQLGAPVGFIAANGLFLILGLTLSEADFFAWGWRIPFLGSALLVILGLWIRLKVTETPEFVAARAEHKPVAVPLTALFSGHWRAALTGTLAVVACFATFYITTTYALSLGTGTLGFSRQSFLTMQIVAILFMALGIILAGWWADVRSGRFVLIAGCIMTVFVGVIFGSAFNSGSALFITAMLSIALFAMGFTYGPLGSYLTDLFPVTLRYTGASFAFNTGGILGGAAAPIVATWLAKTYGLGAVGLYLAIAAAVSLIALVVSKR